MWFKNLKIYKLNEKVSIDQETFEKYLNSFYFSPCTSLETEKSGFVPPLGKLSESLLHVVNGLYIVCARFEKKLLPQSVVKEEIEERSENFLVEKGRSPKGKEKTEIKEDVILALLPKAFATHSDIFAWIDNENGYVIVDTSSDKKAENVLALIRKAIGSLPVTPLSVNDNPSYNMTQWLLNNNIPSQFTLGNQVYLVSTQNENKTITAKSDDLLENDIIQHLKTDKIVQKIALNYEDSLSFILDDALNIKRIKFNEDVINPDDEQKEEYENMDELARLEANLYLQFSYFTRLVPYIIQQFGGLSE